jgi:UrcA family protein
MKKVLISAVIAMLGSASAAQPPLIVTNAPFKVVSYGDLNLSSQSGQDRLASRIRSAARDICLENNIEQVKFTAARRHCYNKAVNNGLSQMNEAVAARASGTTLAAATLVVRGE